MTPSRKPQHAPGENPVLRRGFIHELLAHEHAGDANAFLTSIATFARDWAAGRNALVIPDDPGVEIPDLLVDTSRRVSCDDLRHVRLTDEGRLYFRAWLRQHGIDPDTGRMTLGGLAFFRELTQPDVDRAA